jgi:hypothetical protein
MECHEFDQLERAFVETRRQWLQYLDRGKVSSEQIDTLSRAELKALLAVLDHRAEHGCHTESTRRLPARRNIGGIIGPY